MNPKGKKTPANEKTDSEMKRRFKANPFIFIGSFAVLLLVIVAFVMPSSVGLDSGSNVDLTFGYYDKVPISYVPGNFFAQYYDMVARYRQNTMGGDNFAFMGYQIWREAFEAATVHTAMLQEMKKSGYVVPSKSVDREVAKLPHFQENGRFSSALYRQMDDNYRLSLWRQVQDDMTKNIYRSDIVGLLKPAAEADFISNMASVQRKFEMAVFSVEAYPDAEYEAYARNNASLFRSTHLSMITLSSSERETLKVLDSIKNGEITFEDAARAHSKDNYADMGGDMGIRMVHELNFDIPEESVREQVLLLGKGGYSNVIKSSTGWAFFRADEAVQDADFSDSVTMEKVRSYLRNFERGRMEDWAIAQANSFGALVSEYGFEEALFIQETEREVPVERRSFGPIPINYGSIDLFASIGSQSVTELTNAASDENFWTVAFSTPVNNPSKPVVQGSNVLVLIPTEETEADESALASINSMYNSYWMNYMAEQSLQQHFLNSPKMEDNFIDVYFRYFMN